MSATTPWGLAHKVGKFYEKYRRLRVDSRYRAFSKNGPPDASRNWVHFMRAADVLFEHRIVDPDSIAHPVYRVEEYIAAQFLLATKTVYPRPNNLYSKCAFENWQRVNFMPRIRDAWEHGNMYLGIMMRRFGLSAAEVVRNPYWHWFAPWFRIVFLDEEDLPLYAEEALKSLQSETVRRLLEEVGEDVMDLEARLYRAKEKIT